MSVANFLSKGKKLPEKSHQVGISYLNSFKLCLPIVKLVCNYGDPLNQAVLARLFSGVSCRKYEQTMDIETTGCSCKSKSEVSRRLEGSYPAIMMDGMGFGKMTIKEHIAKCHTDWNENIATYKKRINL